MKRFMQIGIMVVALAGMQGTFAMETEIDDDLRAVAAELGFKNPEYLKAPKEATIIVPNRFVFAKPQEESFDMMDIEPLTQMSFRDLFVRKYYDRKISGRPFILARAFIGRDPKPKYYEASELNKWLFNNKIVPSGHCETLAHDKDPLSGDEFSAIDYYIWMLVPHSNVGDPKFMFLGSINDLRAPLSSELDMLKKIFIASCGSFTDAATGQSALDLYNLLSSRSDGFVANRSTRDKFLDIADRVGDAKVRAQAKVQRAQGIVAEKKISDGSVGRALRLLEAALGLNSLSSEESDRVHALLANLYARDGSNNDEAKAKDHMQKATDGARRDLASLLSNL